MTELLVSVRSVEEAEAALRGGAGLIDVKEPLHGSLGRAADSIVKAVSQSVGERCPVSAALGELLDATPPPSNCRLRYVKWGLAGCLHQRDWRDRLHSAGQRLRETRPACRPVAVAYADWEAAQSSDPADVCAFACEHRWSAFLLDTWRKDGSTLLDYLSIDFVSRLRDACGKRDVRVALAGSLSATEIRNLHHLRPDWFAVRGAVCIEGSRTGLIDSDRVRELAMMLKESIREN